MHANNRFRWSRLHKWLIVQESFIEPRPTGAVILTAASGILRPRDRRLATVDDRRAAYQAAPHPRIILVKIFDAVH